MILWCLETDSAITLPTELLKNGSQINVTLLLQKKGFEDEFAYQLLNVGSIDVTLNLK